jgi:hypothetical protein
VVARKLPQLMKLPGLVIETGYTTEEKRRAVAVDFIVDLGVLSF